jgi:pheromone shutdown-related protein TraB
VRREVNLGDRKVHVVGTAHISKESVETVRGTIREVQPDLVGVELDESRLQSLRNDDGWREIDVSQAIRDGKGYLLAVNLLLSIEQRRMGLETGTEPGTEMLTALDEAEEIGAETALVDRDINKTFRRVFDGLTVREKVRLIYSLLAAEEEIELEDLEQDQIIETIVRELGDDFPSLKRTFLDERNAYMAEKLLERDFDEAVLVVGAAHVEGVVECLENETEYVEKETGSSNLFKYLNYGFIGFIVLGMGYSFTQIDPSTGLQALSFWILSNGILAMLGAIIARAHPLTWIISFLSAPLTSLDPALGAGMVASYAEAKFYPPKVSDLEDVSEITRYRDLWGNQVGRILLTFVFVTLGSAAATFLSAGFITSLISGF